MCVTKVKCNFRLSFVIGSIFFSGNVMVTINKIAKFLTRSSKIPATGLNKNVTVKFKHGCFPSKSGNICKCLPTVSTCVIMGYTKTSDHSHPPPPAHKNIQPPPPTQNIPPLTLNFPEIKWICSLEIWRDKMIKEVFVIWK